MAKKKAGVAELLEAVRQQVDDAARKKRHKPGEAGGAPATTTATTTTTTTTATNGAVPSAASAAAAAQAKWRKQHELLARDLHAATHPNIAGPFTSIEDACERLLPYHVFYEAEEDEESEQPPPSTSGTASATDDARASWHIWQTTYEAKVDEFIKAFTAHKAKLQARLYKMQGPSLAAEEQLMISKLHYAESQSRLASRKPTAPSNPTNIPSTSCNNSNNNISSTSALPAHRPAVSFMTSAARGNNTNNSSVNSGTGASRPNIFAVSGGGSSTSHLVSSSSGSLGGNAAPNAPSLSAPSKQQ